MARYALGRSRTRVAYNESWQAERLRWRTSVVDKEKAPEEGSRMEQLHARHSLTQEGNWNQAQAGRKAGPCPAEPCHRQQLIYQRRKGRRGPIERAAVECCGEEPGCETALMPVSSPRPANEQLQTRKKAFSLKRTPHSPAFLSAKPCWGETERFPPSGALINLLPPCYLPS